MKAIEAIKGSLFWKGLEIFQKAVLILSSIFVALIMCAQVLMRYVSNPTFTAWKRSSSSSPSGST
ncbi:MAG: hypothetical protein PHF19_05885, partial [Synergistales bacterium]|nr:hypothetical protein [Synergistales bacterium]